MKDITSPDENISIYADLGSRIDKCLFLKPVDEEEVINTVKAYSKQICRL